MQTISRQTAGWAAFALITTAATAQVLPIPKPMDEAQRVEGMEFREGTIAGRYKATMQATGVVEDLVEEALAEEGVDGDHMLEAALEPDTSDLPEIRERGYVRFAIAPDPLMIAYDGERALGAAIDWAQELEKHLAKSREGEHTPTVVVPVPTPRNTIAQAVEAGRSDFTPLIVNNDREAELGFTQPLLTDVNDVAVLGAEAPEVGSIDELTEVPLYVSEGGRYARHLDEFNDARREMDLEPLDIRFVDERLDDYDLMEMVEIGLIPGTVMADFKAAFWNQVYPTVEVRKDLELTKDSRIAWAVRTDNPELEKALESFADKVKKGSLIGNLVLQRYFSDADWIESLADGTAQAKIDVIEPVIQEYSELYGFESDLVLAQAYQESGLDQSKRSHVGAIGVMQVMPATAADPVVGIPDVKNLESNVHAGIKYLRWLRDTYYSDPAIEPLDRTLLSFAAYNAGPGGVQRARDLAVKMGLDPNVWFENVELAITKAVSREPAVYVRNIFKYYVSHRLMRELEAEREDARATVAEVGEDVEGLPLDAKIEALEEAEIIVEAGPPAKARLKRYGDPGEEERLTPATAVADD